MVDEPNWAEAERVREQIRGAPQLSTDSLPDFDAEVEEFERIHAALEDAVESWLRGVEQLFPNWDDLRRANPYAVYHELRVALHDWYEHNMPDGYREEEAPQPGGRYRIDMIPNRREEHESQLEPGHIEPPRARDIEQELAAADMGSEATRDTAATGKAADANCPAETQPVPEPADADRGAAARRGAAGVLRASLTRDTEQDGPSPAEPGLDPQSVWPTLTAQERHDAETAPIRGRDAGGPAPRREPIRPEPAADVQAEEDSRLPADLAKAREAAQRLVQKSDATLDPDARAQAEIEAALEAERARLAAEALAAAERDQGTCR